MFYYGLAGAESQQQFQAAQTTGTQSLPVAQQRVQEYMIALRNALQEAEGSFTGAASVAQSIAMTPDISAALQQLQKIYEDVQKLVGAGEHLRTFPRDWVEQAVSAQVHGGWAFGPEVDSDRLYDWNKWQIYDALARALQPLALEAKSLAAKARELREAIVQVVQESQIQHDSTLKQQEYLAQDQQVVDEISRARAQLEADRAARMSTSDLAAAYAAEDMAQQQAIFAQTMETNRQIMAFQQAQREAELERQRQEMEAEHNVSITTPELIRQRTQEQAEAAAQEPPKKSKLPAVLGIAALAAWKFM